jgi:hypothetical protein
MANKVDDKLLRKKLKAIQDALNTKDKNLMMGRWVVDLIRERTRGTGRGVPRVGANLRKLKNVTPEWAERRKSGARGDAATGLNSNLTYKGTMLDKLSVVKATKNSFFIGWNSEEEAEKAEGNEARGRPFMYLSKGEITKASNYLKKSILKNI